VEGTDKIHVYLLIAEPVAEPCEGCLEGILLKLLYERAQSAYDDSSFASNHCHGKAAIIVYAPNQMLQFFETLGYQSLTRLKNGSSSSVSISVKHCFSPLSDFIRDFKAPVTISETTPMLLFLPRQRVSGVSGALNQQLSSLMKSEHVSLIGAFVHVNFTQSLKALLCTDAALNTHLTTNSIYKSTKKLGILGLVTDDLPDGQYDVLLCIDNDVVLKNREKLKTFVEDVSNGDSIGYVCRRICNRDLILILSSKPLHPVQYVLFTLA